MFAASKTIFTYVYVCGHTSTQTVEEDSFPGGMNTIFNDFPCPDHPECYATDPRWFHEQDDSYGEADRLLLDRLFENKQQVIDGAWEQVARFDYLEPELTETIEEQGSVQVADLLIAPYEERDAALNTHFSAILNMNQHLLRMYQFAANGAPRAFFNYCLEQAGYNWNQAQARLEILRETVDRLAAMQRPRSPVSPFIIDVTTPSTPTPIQWPNTADYEPDFGVKELQILRSAGGEAQQLLQAPISQSALDKSGQLMGKQLLSILTPTTALAPAPSQSVPRKAKSTDRIDELERWLKEEEYIFKMEQLAKRRPRKHRSKRRLYVIALNHAMAKKARFMKSQVSPSGKGGLHISPPLPVSGFESLRAMACRAGVAKKVRVLKGGILKK